MNDPYLSQLDADGVHVTTRPYLNKVLQHTEPYEVEVFDRSITVFPGVMSPAYDWAGHFMIDRLPNTLSGKDVLELGSGTGLVSVFAGLRGAQSVTATDINPAAVRNTQLNFDKFGIPSSQVILSDVFGAIPERRYDVIIFNLPYHDSHPQNDLEKGVMDDGYKTMERFFRDVGSYLKPGGELFVGFSRSGNLERLQELVERNELRVVGFWERNNWDQDSRFIAPELQYNCQVYRLTERFVLPLLDWVVKQTTKERPTDCLILAHMHLLPNNVPLFRHLGALVDVGRVFVLDKPYSTVPAVFRQLVLDGFEVIPVRAEPNLPYEFSIEESLRILWKKVVSEVKRHSIKQLLIVDDGGEIWHSIPRNDLPNIQIVAVEQTQRGITRIGVPDKICDLPPVISVATSGIKKLVEPIFIGTSVVNKLIELNQFQARRVGIIGMGSIGQAIHQTLKKRGIKASFYDSSKQVSLPQTSEACASLHTLINANDLLIGTTGTDVLKGLAFNQLNDGKKIFVSASSADVEFASLLKLSKPHSDPFGAVHVQLHADLSIEIINGGYPVNFDRERDTTPSQDIVLTRCLMYIGAIQALRLLEEIDRPPFQLYHLDPVAQEGLLTRWIDEKAASKQTVTITREQVHAIASFTTQMEIRPTTSVWSLL